MTDELRDEIKSKMMAALAKKQNQGKKPNSDHSATHRKIGTGQPPSGALKMHRRKSGSA